MKKILIVDDLRIFVEQEKSILSRADVTIYTASSGKDAYAIHKAEKVDLLIVDMDMPGMSGAELCDKIREDEELRGVSILLVGTGGASEKDAVLRCRANGFISKPIKAPELIEKAGTLLSISERKSYRVLLKVKVNGNTVNETFFCSSRNISSSGILIETEKKLGKGDKLHLSFFLPDGAKIETDGEVTRTMDGAGAVQYGVKYLNIRQDQKNAIEVFIKNRAQGR